MTYDMNVDIYQKCLIKMLSLSNVLKGFVGDLKAKIVAFFSSCCPCCICCLLLNYDIFFILLYPCGRKLLQHKLNKK